MSDLKDNATPPAAQPAEQKTNEPAPATNTAAQNATNQALDEVEGIDFLLEEIENKIAPLALA